MRHWASCWAKCGRRRTRHHPGSGAAGGTAFGALALGARLVDGAETLLDLAGFDEDVAGRDLVITGEGRLDRADADGQGARGRWPGAPARARRAVRRRRRQPRRPTVGPCCRPRLRRVHAAGRRGPRGGR